MPIVVGNGTIEAELQTFTIKNSSGTKVFKRGISFYQPTPGTYRTHGFYENSNVPGFIAGSLSNPGWVNFGTNAWVKVNNYCTNTTYNRGNHYSTANTRFTAPETGPYLFTWTTYQYSSNYIHPQFAVNGSVSARRYNTPYRIRGYGFAANYQTDGMIEEVIYCLSGDYVECYSYAGGTAYHYPHFSLFTGIFVG